MKEKQQIQSKLNPSQYYMTTPPNAGPCEKIPIKQRPLAAGANIQQCMWKPTKRRVRPEILVGKPSFKALPTVIGPKIADSTKRSGPAYTFGQRRSYQIKGSEEGPAKFDISGLCNRGPYRKKGIVIKSRLPEISSRTIIPGVGSYTVGSAYRAANKGIPHYTFGKRLPPSKPFITPAPNVYDIPTLVGTSKENNKKSPPAYSLLGRPKSDFTHVTPGPGDYEDQTIIKSKDSPMYSMRRLYKTFDDNLNKPGPGAYCPEKTMTHKSVPAPSFSIQYPPHMSVRKVYLIKDCQQQAKGEI